MIGCWDTSTDFECRVSQCYSYSKPVKALNNTKFCCCYGHMCNANITEANDRNDYIDTITTINEFSNGIHFFQLVSCLQISNALSNYN